MKHISLKDERGFIFVIVILIVFSLIALIMSFSRESAIEISLAGYSKDSYLAYQLAYSAVQSAIFLLDKDKRKVDSLKEDWAMLNKFHLLDEIANDGSVSCRIIDENSKLNVNYLVNKDGKLNQQRENQLKRLFNILDIEENFLYPLLDWLDKDDIPRLKGAEDSYYMELKYPYHCANSPFESIGQIFLVKGMKKVEQILRRRKKSLLDFITIYSNGKININTAPKEVIQSLSPKIDADLAKAIVEYRKEEDFQSINDLMKVPGVDSDVYDNIRKWITVRSSAFSIEAQGRYGDAVCYIKAVLKREKKGYKLIYWKVS